MCWLTRRQLQIFSNHNIEKCTCCRQMDPLTPWGKDFQGFIGPLGRGRSAMSRKAAHIALDIEVMSFQASAAFKAMLLRGVAVMNARLTGGNDKLDMSRPQHKDLLVMSHHDGLKQPCIQSQAPRSAAIIGNCSTFSIGMPHFARPRRACLPLLQSP